jgi:cellobiose phosphorylase
VKITHQIDGLSLDPCLPAAWTSTKVERTFRGTSYVVRYAQKGEGRRSRVAEMRVDRQPWSSPLLPHRPGETINVDILLQRS